MDPQPKGRYFYLMLKENFYDSDDMVLLESMDNGYLYSNILLKLYLKSLKDKGKLMYKDRIPYSAEMLAKLTRHNVDVVRNAIKIFEQMGIVEVLDNGAIFMLDIENYIGKSSTEADRKRKYNRRISQEKQVAKLEDKQVDKCPAKCPDKCHDKSPAYLDLDLDLELNKKNIYKKIIEYLNSKAQTKYKYTSKNTQSLIKSRLNENYNFEDFKKVIDTKCSEWLNTEMEKYLRPQTLFGSKFESYLNQKIIKSTTTPEWFDKKIDSSEQKQDEEEFNKFIEEFRK